MQFILFMFIYFILVFIVYNFDKILKKVEYLRFKATQKKVKADIDKLSQTSAKILTNKIKCNKCGDIIESTHRHDFKFCKCQSIAVDGGREYLRRLFTKISDFTEMSESK
jgi:tRNA(Ile2) C34 agmatinyltransferase TiaS